MELTVCLSAVSADILRLIFSRMQLDGDMAGSGSALDPLFWAAHGAVERMYQRAMFEGVVADKEYRTTGDPGSECQGHNASLPLYWLKGFEFEDRSVLAHEVILLNAL